MEILRVDNFGYSISSPLIKFLTKNRLKLNKKTKLLIDGKVKDILINLKKYRELILNNDNI